MCEIFEEIRAEGRAEGQNSMIMLIQKLEDQGRIEEILRIGRDKEYRAKLMKEFAIA